MEMTSKWYGTKSTEKFLWPHKMLAHLFSTFFLWRREWCDDRHFEGKSARVQDVSLEIKENRTEDDDIPAKRSRFYADESDSSDSWSSASYN